MIRRFFSSLSAILCFGVLWLCPALSEAQSSTSSTTPAAQSDSVPVFRAHTRVVLVDVIVADKKGQLVPDLKVSDFTVLEDGKEQKISGFALHRFEPAKASPSFQMPPNMFTNFAQQDPGGAITIVMLDTLNTPVLQQNYARKGMLEFLQKLPPGQQVALFLLSDKPRLVTGFNSPSDVLIQAGKAMSAPHTSILNEADPTAISPLGLTVAAVESGFANRSAMISDLRLRLTLASLNALARAVSGYTGRKNLLWLSGDFPLRLGIEDTSNNRAGFGQQYTSDILETAALLAASQVAVYPIDVTGVDRGISSGIFSDTAPNVIGRTASLWDKEGAMDDIARETGGKSFRGNNAIGESLLSGLKQGSDYYTLAYAPENHDWNGRYRKIEIKMPIKGVKLTHRRGYYATVEKEFTGDQAAKALATAMRPMVPGSTMLLLKVQVLPPDAQHKTVRIDYAVDAHDINFTDTSDKSKHVAVDFMAVAWDKDFNNAGYQTDTIETDFRPEAYQQIMQTGFPAHQELAVKPGTYTLRLGVIDRGSQKVGTVDVPLTIPGTEQAQK